MNANGEQLHQLLAKLVNRVQNDSIDSLQSFDYLLNILQCLEQIKEPARIGSDSLLSEAHSELNTELNTECLNVDLNSELINDSNESDSGQQSSEEGSTINDLKVSTNQKCLFELILKLISIILNHLVRQVNTKQDAELLINQWNDCLCFKQTKTNHNCSNNLNNNQTTSLFNALQSSTIQSSGIQSDASCSPLSSLTTDCYANLSTNCSLSPSCCYTNANRSSAAAAAAQNSKCSLSFNKAISCLNSSCHNDNVNGQSSAEVPLNTIPIESSSNVTLNASNTNSTIPIPPPLPPPLPNQNGLDKSISNGSLNNQLLTNSFNSNLSNNLSPPQSINEVPVILLEAPKPRSKMKTLNWNKISVHKVLTSHKPNIWSKLFSKKDDSKKSKQTKEDKNKKRKSKKNFSTDDETSDEDFKNSQRFNLTKRNKKADNNNNTTTATTSSTTILPNLTNRSQSLKSSNSSINSSTNNLSKINSTSNNSIKTESSINSTNSSTSIKKQSEEDLMNIVKLDFDTLEGLFCQSNNQVNIGAGNVGSMIANFSTSNANNGEMISCPNSPASNRRILQQSTNQSQLKLNSIYNQLSHSTQLNQPNSQLMHQANSHSQLNYSNLNLNQAYLTNYPLNSSQSNGQLNCKLNKLNNKLELNGRNSPNCFENSLDRKTLKQRCSGEFQTDFMMHNILDSKRSLNINIFLKQFRSVCSNDGEIEIMKLICKGDHAVFGAEKLVHLIKLLPDQAEIDLLKAHFDDLSRLPLAERFLIQLMAIPKYKLRLECMLLKAEYEANFSYLNPSLDTLINAAKELENCRKLHEILYLILIAGNFLNSGGYAGDAAGFRMMSLLKISEIRANKPGISLIHYVALQANKKHLSGFVNELNSVEKASKISLESVKIDINSLANKIFKIKQQINSADDLDCSEWSYNEDGKKQNASKSNDQDQQQMNTTFFQHMREFLSDAEKQIKQLTQKVETDLEQIRTQLGEFLCEELNEFKLEECFRIFSCFITKFKLALEENAKRKDEFKLISSKQDQSIQSNQQNLINLNSNFKNTKSNNLNSQFNSLPRFNQKKSSKLFQNSSIHNNLSIMNLAEENGLDPGLVEFLSKANELNGNSSDLFNGLSTFRRVGSGRRSFRQLNSANVFANNEIDFSSRERLNINLNCSKITEEENTKKEDESSIDYNDKEGNESNDSNNLSTKLNHHNYDFKTNNVSEKEDLNVYTAKSISSLTTNNDNFKSNTPMAVITPTLYSPSTQYASSNNFTTITSPSEYVNNYTNKLLEKAQSQLSLNSIGNSNKVIPIRSNPLTPLLSNSHGSLKRLNSRNFFGSTELDSHNYDDLKNFKDYEDLKKSNTNLKTCIQSLESLNNITSSRYQQDKNSLNSLTYQERTRSLSKHSSNKSPLQSLNLYNSLKRGSSERHSFKYQVSSKVDCHNPIYSYSSSSNQIVANRNLYKENSHTKDDLLDSCKYILPKTSPVLSTLNRASILRMSLNRKTQEAKSTSSLFHSSKSPSTPRISTTTRPINLNPKKSSLYNSVYIEPTYIDINKSKSSSLAAIKPLSRVNSFRTSNSMDKTCHQSRATIRTNNKSVHSSSAHSTTQPRWIC